MSNFQQHPIIEKVLPIMSKTLFSGLAINKSFLEQINLKNTNNSSLLTSIDIKNTSIIYSNNKKMELSILDDAKVKYLMKFKNK